MVVEVLRHCESGGELDDDKIKNKNRVPAILKLL